MEDILDELLELMPDEVIVEKFVTSDGYGDDQYDEDNPINARARVSGKVRTVTGEDGVEYVSTLQITFNGAYGFTTADRYTVPIRFSTNRTKDPTDLNARQPRPVKVVPSGDENGAHHETVFFV